MLTLVTDAERTKRTSFPYYRLTYIREIAGQPGSYSAVHRICDLEQCIKDYGIVTDKLEKNKPGKDIFNAVM